MTRHTSGREEKRAHEGDGNTGASGRWEAKTVTGVCRGWLGVARNGFRAGV